MNYRAVIIAAAQAAVLYGAGFVIPVLGQAFALFTPVPFIIIYVRYGVGEGVAAIALSSALITFLVGWQAALILWLSFGLMALGTSEGMRRKWKPESATLLGGLLPVAAIGFALAYYFLHAGRNPVTAVEEYLKGSIAEAAAFYTSLGLADMAAVVSAVSDTFVHYLVRLIPGIAIATSVVQAACCFGLARALIMRRPGTGPALKETSLAAWHAPDGWVWGLIAALAAVLVPNEAVRFTGLNVAILYLVVYTAQGMANVEHALRKSGIPAAGRGFIHAVILALPTVVFLIALGVVDIWADFRKVRVAEKTGR